MCMNMYICLLVSDILCVYLLSMYLLRYYQYQMDLYLSIYLDVCIYISASLGVYNPGTEHYTEQTVCVIKLKLCIYNYRLSYREYMPQYLASFSGDRTPIMSKGRIIQWKISSVRSYYRLTCIPQMIDLSKQISPMYSTQTCQITRQGYSPPLTCGQVIH